MKTQITLAMIWLIVMLPIVQAVSLQEPAAQAPQPLFVKAEIPRYPRTEKIDIPGATKPGALVSVSINGAEVRKDTIANGTFLFRNVQLIKGDNAINFKAELAGETAEQAYNATVDTAPPKLNVSLPSFVTTGTATAKVTVSEPVTLKVKAQGQAAPLDRATGLKQANVAANDATITWDAMNATKVLEYAVYRDDQRIATIREPTYRDSTLAGGTTYQYQVSAVNQGCVEGELSNILTVKTPAGGQGQSVKPVKLSCETEAEKQLQAGTTEVPVQLKEGVNVVTFTAIDKAGFTSETEERIAYDTGPPTILETNLDKLSPSYKEDIVIRGKLSEPGSVTAFVNGQPQKTVQTGADNSFEIPVRLVRANATSPVTAQAAIDIGWRNKIRLEAVDIAGQKTATPEQEISFAVCGYGTWVDVQTTEPMPDTLIPRLLIEGIQQIGIAFSYSYRGSEKAIINPSLIRARKMELSPEIRDDYDNGLVTVYVPPITAATRVRKPSGAGYVQVNFNPIPDPWALKETGTAKKAQPPTNQTMFDREERVSQHREGKCKLPGFGCIRLLLELEIPIQEEIQKAGYLPETTRTLETTKLENKVQRSCMEIEVSIDKRIPPKYIPAGFLKATSEFLGTIISGIDKVLKPIETIGKYLFYTCLAGTVLMLVPIFLEKWNCEYKSVTQAVTGEGKFDPNVAAIGACDKVYPAGSSQDNCKNCQDYKKFRVNTRFYYRQICDRITCPAAPSLQYYMKTKGTQRLGEVSVPPAAKVERVNNKVYIGSDCGAWMLKNNKVQPGRAQKLFFTTQEIEEVYRNYLKHQPDKAGDDTGGANCASLHPATPECCGYEYMQEWSSACGVSAFGSTVDTFDEIKQSTCLAEQKVNKNEVPGPEGTTVECNKLFNSLAGFCDKEGGKPTETIRVAPFCCESAAQPTGRIRELGLGASREKYLYMILVPQKTSQELFSTTTGEYTIKLGYLQGTTEFEQSPSKAITPDDQRFTVNAKMEGIALPAESTSIQQYFSKQNIDLYYQNKLPEQTYASFKRDLCVAAGYVSGQCDVDAKNLYAQVMSYIGGKDEEYIVKPSSGLINSARCVCIPTLMKYLKQWRNIMVAVQSCVNSILLTGDGEAGVCQAVVSQYACDLIYDAVACFTQKFFSGGPGRTGLGEGGDVMGALVSSGSELSREVEGRYGETGIYKTMFVDRKLLHSICMFAFTGTWNLNLASIFDQAVEDVPIESYALLFPCDRRYVRFDPGTTPSGLTTWLYHFGVGLAAGANVEVELKLKCSTGFRCDPNDGYDRGECDCNKMGERTITILPNNIPTKIRSGTILNEEVFQTVQGSMGEGNVRYDTAKLTYRWEELGKRQEKSVDCKISQRGGAGSVPSICSFDPLTLTFRCQFGQGTTGILLQGAKVNAPHKIPQDVFALNENIDVALGIRQDYPTPPDFKNSKFLQYVVKNQANQVVASNKDDTLAPLTRNGDYTVSTTDVSAFKRIPKLDRSWFGTGTGVGGRNYQTKSWYSAQPNIAAPGDDIINSIVINGKDDKPIKDTRNLILSIENKDGTEKYTIYRATGIVTVDPVIGFSNKGSAYISDQILTSTTINFVGTPVPVIAPAGGAAGAQREYFEGSIIINLARAPTGLAKGEKKQVYILYNPQQVSNPCLSETEKFKPQRFTITFTAFDADNFGTPNIDQTSVNPFTGQEAVLSQDIFVVCAEPTDPNLTNLEQKAGGQIPYQELKPRLNDLLKRAQKNETDAYKNIEVYTDPAKKDLGDQQIYNSLRVEIQKLTDQEQKLSTDLEPFKEPLAEDLTQLLSALSDNTYTITQKRDAISRTRDITEVHSNIQDILRALKDLLDAKKAMSDMLAGPVTSTQCAGLDSQKNYNSCRTACGVDEIPVTDKICAGLNKCCKIPAERYCANDKGDEFNYKCATSQPAGWDAADFYSTGGGVLIKLLCPGDTENCYKQLKTGALISLEDKLIGLKTTLSTALKLSEITEIPGMTTQEASNYLTAEKKAGLIKVIDDLKTSLSNEADAIKKKRDQSSASTIPAEINEAINTVLASISQVQNQLDEPKAAINRAASVPEIIAATSQVSSLVASLSASSNAAVGAINAKLGIPSETCAQGFGAYRETKCFDGPSCPSTSAPFSWYNIFKDCGPAGKVCCERKTAAQFFEGPQLLPLTATLETGAHTFTVKFPYEDKTDIEKLMYEFSHPPQTGPLQQIQTSPTFNDAERVASVDLPAIDISDAGTLIFVIVTKKQLYYTGYLFIKLPGQE